MKAPHIKTALPGPKAKAIVERDHQVTAPAYGRVYPLVVKRAAGMVVEDVDGNLFLDFMAGIAVASTGDSAFHHSSAARPTRPAIATTQALGSVGSRSRRNTRNAGTRRNASTGGAPKASNTTRPTA